MVGQSAARCRRPWRRARRAARRSGTRRYTARRTRDRGAGPAQAPAGRRRCGSRVEPERRAPTWLPRMLSRPEWKRAAQRQAHLAVAVPAQLDHCALRREQFQRSAGARRTSRWRARPGRGRRRPRPAARTRRRAPPRRRPVAASTSTSWTVTPGNRARRRATQQPTIPAPTTVIRSPTSGAASHSALTAVSTVPASTARAGRHVIGYDDHGVGRDDVGGLMRVEAEHGAARAAPRGPLRRRRR